MQDLSTVIFFKTLRFVMIYCCFYPFSLFQTSLLRILIFSDAGRVNWTDESPEWWPSDITFANPTGRHGFTSQQCDKVIHAFIEANVIYMEPDSADLLMILLKRRLLGLKVML